MLPSVPLPDSGMRLARLAAGWVHGGAPAGGPLPAPAPPIAPRRPRGGLVVWLCRPIHKLHRQEGHDAECFRSGVDERLADGVEALTDPAVFWINILGVWAVIA
ncbi:MAG: hypothetical protein ACK4NE_08170, partial [Albidovulum sp.]